jgi:hypothetical protein
MKSEPEPVLSRYDQVSNKKTFGSACEVQHSYGLIDFGCNIWTDGSFVYRMCQ